MDFITVDYGVNESFYVSLTAIESIIREVIIKTDNLKIINFKITTTLDGKNVCLFLVIESPSKNFTYSGIITKLQKNIVYKIIDLIDVKPSNIEINLKNINN